MKPELFSGDQPKLSAFHLPPHHFAGNSNLLFDARPRNPLPETPRPKDLDLSNSCLVLSIYNYLAYERYPSLPPITQFLQICRHLGFDPDLVNYDEAPAIFKYFHINFSPYQIKNSTLEIKPWLDRQGAFIALVWENNLDRLNDHQIDGDGHYKLVISVDRFGRMLCLNSSLRGSTNTYGVFTITLDGYFKIAYDFLPARYPYFYPDEYTIVPGLHTWLHAAGYLVSPGW